MGLPLSSDSTARSTSAALAFATRAISFSEAGEIVVNDSPSAATNSLPMNRPYSGLRFRIAVDSGAGAYSRNVMTGS
jgi:hypothetical protein